MGANRSVRVLTPVQVSIIQVLTERSVGSVLSVLKGVHSVFQDGELLVKQMAGWGVPVSLSLSVCSVCPFIIFETADIDSAVDGLMDSAFRNYTEVRKLHEGVILLYKLSLSASFSVSLSLTFSFSLTLSLKNVLLL